jgi:hypothetical protein
MQRELGGVISTDHLVTRQFRLAAWQGMLGDALSARLSGMHVHITSTGMVFSFAAETMYRSGFGKKAGMGLLVSLARLAQTHDDQRENPIHQRPNDQEAEQK